MQHVVTKLILSNKTHLTQIKCENVDRIQLAQDMIQWLAFANAVMEFRVTKN